MKWRRGSEKETGKKKVGSGNEDAQVHARKDKDGENKERRDREGSRS